MWRAIVVILVLQRARFCLDFRIGVRWCYRNACQVPPGSMSVTLDERRSTYDHLLCCGRNQTSQDTLHLTGTSSLSCAILACVAGLF